MRLGATQLSKALLAAACVAASAEAPLAGPKVGLSSTDLLNDGFKLVAEGDLLTVREFGGDVLLDEGIFVFPYGPSERSGCNRERTFIAEMPSLAKHRDCGHVTWWNDRYDEFMRLKRGHEEFVCVVGPAENCYRAYN